MIRIETSKVDNKELAMPVQEKNEALGRQVVVAGLTIFKPDGGVLIKDLHLSLKPGAILGIIGDEGVGKSILLKTFIGQLPEGFKTTGEIRRSTVGYLPQILSPDWNAVNNFEFFFKHTPGDSFEPGAWNHYNNVVSAVLQIGLNPVEMFDSERTIETLSGGELTRLRLAKLIFEGATTLLLDEPTNHLDLYSIIWLEKFLKNRGDPSAVVSHDESFLKEVATDILYLQRGKRGEPLYRLNGNGYQAFLDQFADEVEKTNQLADNFNQTQRHLKIRLNEERISAEATARKQQPQNAAEKARQMRGFSKITKRRAGLEKRVEAEEAPQRVLADERIRLSVPPGCGILPGKLVCDICFSNLIIADKVLAKNIRLTVSGPEKIVIIGSNGSGKSTFLGKLKEEMELNTKSNFKIGYLPQNYFSLVEDPNQNTLQFLESIELEESRKRSVLAALNLDHDTLERSLLSLSGGQLGKVLLASLILKECNVLLLDEPTNNLYPLSTRELRRFISIFPGAVVAISHDRSFVTEVATRIIEFVPNEGLQAVGFERAVELGLRAGNPGT